MERCLMKGNEALAETAIRAGCKCFFGYPITPQTELSAYMAKYMEKSGGVFLQAESEIAAINMVLGAASTGVRAMTSSSSPGISLKSEGISYMAASDLPGVIVNVQRGGRGSVRYSLRSLITFRLRAQWVTVTSIFRYTRLIPFRKWLTPLCWRLTGQINTVLP